MTSNVPGHLDGQHVSVHAKQPKLPDWLTNLGWEISVLSDTHTFTEVIDWVADQHWSLIDPCIIWATVCKDAPLCWKYVPFSCLHTMSHEPLWQVIVRDLRSTYFSYDSSFLHENEKLLSIKIELLFFFVFFLTCCVSWNQRRLQSGFLFWLTLKKKITHNRLMKHF